MRSLMERNINAVLDKCSPQQTALISPLLDVYSLLNANRQKHLIIGPLSQTEVKLYYKLPLVKGTVHPKIKILSSFTHPQVVLNLYECLFC